MQHVLVQQLKKRDDVLAVVKERIITTSSCSVTLTKNDQCTFHGVLRLMGMLGSSVKVRERTFVSVTLSFSPIDQKLMVIFVFPPQVSVKDSTNIEADSDVSLEIPPGTVIAYSILELEIRKNGQYGEGIKKKEDDFKNVAIKC